MFYYKFNEVSKGTDRYTFIQNCDLQLGERENEKIYHTLDGKNCVVACDYKVDLTTQPKEIKLTPINEDTFDTLKQNCLEWSVEWQQLKLARAAEMSSKTTEVKKVIIDIDETAMNRIQRGITLANAQFNLLLSQGKTPKEAAIAYQATVDWKTADNKFVSFSILDAMEALKNGIEIQTEVWKKYK